MPYAALIFFWVFLFMQYFLKCCIHDIEGNSVSDSSKNARLCACFFFFYLYMGY